MFWDYLEVQRCVEMRGANGKMFRIKGCINNYGLEMNEKPNDKQIVLRELQSVTLLLRDGRERVERVVNHKTDKDELSAWIRGTPFRQASHGASAEALVSVHALLLQLKGLLRDA